MKKLNLGCGKDIRVDYINMDIVPNKGVDVVHNMEKMPYPFPNNYFDEIVSIHALEHTSNFIEIMNEIHRISKYGCIIKIEVPYFPSITSFSTPDHRSFFSTRSFNYFRYNHQQHFIAGATFEILNLRLYFTRRRLFLSKIIEYFVNNMVNIYERFFCFIFPMQEIHYKLKVIK